MEGQRFSLEPSIDDAPLQKDGLCIRTAALSSGTIGSDADLRQVLSLGDPDRTIVAIRRADMDREYLDAIRFDAEERGLGSKTKYTHWNQTGGYSPLNAMPHRHDAVNVHVAITESKQPTAFFSRDAVREAVRTAAVDLRHPIALRRQLGNALYNDERKPHRTNALYEGLLCIESTRDRQLPLLECIQGMQKEMRDRTGMVEIPLTQEEHAAVIIPKNSIHARSLLADLFRTDADTAWRYFA